MFGLSPNWYHGLQLHPSPPIRVSYHSCLGGPRHFSLTPLATLRVGIQQCLQSLSSSPRKDHRSALHSSTVFSPFLGSWSLLNPSFNPYWNIHFAPYLFASAQIRHTAGKRLYGSQDTTLLQRVWTVCGRGRAMRMVSHLRLLQSLRHKYPPQISFISFLSFSNTFQSPTFIFLLLKLTSYQAEFFCP